MSNLISRSDVLELLYKIFDKYCMSTDKNTSLGKCFGTDVFEEIRNIPAAYDINKVIKEMEYEREDAPEDEDYWSWACAIDKAIGIVKAGVKNEN